MHIRNHSLICKTTNNFRIILWIFVESSIPSFSKFTVIFATQSLMEVVCYRRIGRVVHKGRPHPHGRGDRSDQCGQRGSEAMQTSAKKQHLLVNCCTCLCMLWNQFYEYPQQGQNEVYLKIIRRIPQFSRLTKNGIGTRPDNTRRIVNLPIVLKFQDL